MGERPILLILSYMTLICCALAAVFYGGVFISAGFLLFPKVVINLYECRRFGNVRDNLFFLLLFANLFPPIQIVANTELL